MKRNFEIDAGIKSILPPLSDDEREGLHTQMRSRGHVDPLVILVLKDSGRRILGDGHNRLEIADQLKLPYATRDVHVDDYDAAQMWVIEHQLGRRNLPVNLRSYYRGKEYLNKKKPVGNPQLGHSAPIGAADGSTAEKIAEKHGVDPKTIKRDAEFAQGVNALPEKAKAKVLSGDATATKAEVATSIFCARCKRAGPSKDCKDCAELRAKKPRKPRAPKQGREKFDWRAFDTHFGKVARAPDDLAKAYGDKGDEYKECQQHLREFIRVWKAWQKKVAKL